MVRAWKFRTTINAMLADIKSGRVRNIPNYVVPEQKQRVSDVVMLPVVANYSRDLGKLKLTNYYREDNHVWALVTAKQKDGSGFGQGKLRWVWNGKEWKFDALNSYVTAGLIGDDEDAMSIGERIDHFLSGKSSGEDAEDAFQQ